MSAVFNKIIFDDLHATDEEMIEARKFGTRKTWNDALYHGEISGYLYKEKFYVDQFKPI